LHTIFYNNETQTFKYIKNAIAKLNFKIHHGRLNLHQLKLNLYSLNEKHGSCSMILHLSVFATLSASVNASTHNNCLRERWLLCRVGAVLITVTRPQKAKKKILDKSQLAAHFMQVFFAGRHRASQPAVLLSRRSC
jgi:hypothetical protein